MPMEHLPVQPVTNALNDQVSVDGIQESIVVQKTDPAHRIRKIQHEMRRDVLPLDSIYGGCLPPVTKRCAGRDAQRKKHACKLVHFNLLGTKITFSPGRKKTFHTETYPVRPLSREWLASSRKNAHLRIENKSKL